MIRTYRELSRLKTFEERYNYLKLAGTIGVTTFGYDRYLNQILYTSREWKKARDIVIVRDEGCDLGMEDYEIQNGIWIHHMNPLTPEDIESGSPDILDPEFLISASRRTHDAIHYGDISLLPKQHIDRRQNDTCPWR